LSHWIMIVGKTVFIPLVSKSANVSIYDKSWNSVPGSSDFYPYSDSQFFSQSIGY